MAVSKSGILTSPRWYQLNCKPHAARGPWLIEKVDQMFLIGHWNRIARVHAPFPTFTEDYGFSKWAPTQPVVGRFSFSRSFRDRDWAGFSLSGVHLDGHPRLPCRRLLELTRLHDDEAEIPLRRRRDLLLGHGGPVEPFAPIEGFQPNAMIRVLRLEMDLPVLRNDVQPFPAGLVLLRTVFRNPSHRRGGEVDFSRALTYPSACSKKKRI